MQSLTSRIFMGALRMIFSFAVIGQLKGGLIMQLWEDLNNARLKKEMKLLKENSFIV